MKNKKIILLIALLLLISMVSADAQIIYEAKECNLSVITKKDINYFIMELINLETNQVVDTIWTRSWASKPERIHDLKFSENFCGFILVTEGLIQYILLAKQESKWKVIGGEILLFRGRSGRKLGFGGVRLLDEFTIVIQEVGRGQRVFSKIYMYDEQGEKKVFEEVGFDEFREKN